MLWIIDDPLLREFPQSRGLYSCYYWKYQSGSCRSLYFVGVGVLHRIEETSDISNFSRDIDSFDANKCGRFFENFGSIVWIFWEPFSFFSCLFNIPNGDRWSHTAPHFRLLDQLSQVFSVEPETSVWSFHFIWWNHFEVLNLPHNACFWGFQLFLLFSKNKIWNW